MMTADQIKVGQVFKLRYEDVDPGWESVKIVAAVPQIDPEPFRAWNVHKADGIFAETREIEADTLLTEADYVEG